MTASREPATEQATPRSRRAILAGALGGIGAWAASAIGSRSPVRAADDDPILVGGEYGATSVTSLTNGTNGNTVFRADSSSGVGLWGFSATANGIVGQSTTNAGIQGTSEQSTGVYGNSQSQIGVRGHTSSADFAGVVGSNVGGATGTMGYAGDLPVPLAPAKVGVYGIANIDGSARGVLGVCDAGQGVRGESTSGVGLYGSATSGFALQAAGRAKFSTSGVASIPAGSTSVTVTPGVNIVGGSFVLLTPMANLGARALWFTKNETTNTFTIRISSSRTSATKIAWLLLG